MIIRQRARELIGRAVRSELTTVEGAGVANAVASIAVSFDRGLVPRTTPQQAGLTGLWGALTYSATATTQAVIEAAVRRAGSQRLTSARSRRAAIMTADAAAIAGGILVKKALAKQPDEPLVRAGGRAAGWRLTLAGVSGLIALSVDVVHDQITNSDEEQTINALATVAAGTAVAGGMYLLRTRRLIDTGVETDQFGDEVQPRVAVQPVRAIVVGVGVTTGLFLLSRAERYTASAIAEGIAFVAPAAEPYANALGHMVTLGGLTFGASQAIGAVYRTTETAGEAVEKAYGSVPDSPFVSGGPRSAEDWGTFGREGRRYVNMALTAGEIESVTGEPATHPIRAYVGLGTDTSPNRRAARAMTELEQLGAFQRDTIAVFFPTGTGYVNYVALESLEYFTGGNVASIAIQYSVRPSFLSLGEVGTARESNLLLLNRLAERIKALPADRRPRLLLFGESLGSLGGQDVLDTAGTDDLDHLRVHRALFIGTPFASVWRQRWHATPETVDPQGVVVEVQGIEEWRALSAAQRERTRVVLLTHNNDPIPKFGRPLFIQEPDWMGPREQRPQGVPQETAYVPGLTFLITAVDLLNADNVRPGTFEAFAHDYRADLAEMVRAAYGLEVSEETMAAVEAALRKREALWAERRLITETLDKAESQIRDTITGWGINADSMPRFVEPRRDVAPDPYAVSPEAAEQEEAAAASGEAPSVS
jgi:uncharacterized membrane protein